MRFLAGVTLVLAAAGPATAQAPDPMRQLDWLVGRWRGHGSMAIGPGERRNASATETATLHAGGRVLVLEGIGKAKVPGKAEEVTVHEAFATIWHDSTGFRMRAFRANGHTVEPHISVAEGRVIWGFVDPRAGQVRFTVTHTEDGQWLEVGDLSRDQGATWMRFFEMKLARATGE